jgi:putative ABC transport system permease protein
MLAESPKPGRLAALWVALRFARRELRGGLRGFGVFIACIALGVMAIAGVGSVAASLNDGIASAGRALLGGDIAFWLIERQASDAERAFLGAQGQVSVATDLRAMARTADGRSTLVELKAVDGNYPLYGVVATNPAIPLPRCSRKPAACSARSPIRHCWRGSI